MIFELKDVTYLDHEWLVDLHNDPVVLKNVTCSIITGASGVFGSRSE